MTIQIVVLMILGLIFIFASFFLSEKKSRKSEDFKIDLLTVDDNYQFSDRERQLIKRKIEDVIAKQAEDILYQTNESLSSMANEKTMALGDYAVSVCDEIEKNHKEVMFLYSMLGDKQKEILNTVKTVEETSAEVTKAMDAVQGKLQKTEAMKAEKPEVTKTEKPVVQSAIEQLTALSKQKQDAEETEPVLQETKSEQAEQEPEPSVDIQEPHTENAAKEEQTDTEFETMLEELEQDEELSADSVLEEEFKENENSNDIILQMYRNGDSILEIARQLGLGVGEVKLVIDLYQGE